MRTIQEHRMASILNTVVIYPEGTMTRLQWLKLKKSQGATVIENTIRNHAAEEKMEQWLYNNRGDRSGNPNWPPTKRYLEKKQELANGIFKTVYSLQEVGGGYEITKTEFNAFQNL